MTESEAITLNESIMLLLKHGKSAQAEILHATAQDSKQSMWLEMARKDLTDVIVNAQKALGCL